MKTVKLTQAELNLIIEVLDQQIEGFKAAFMYTNTDDIDQFLDNAAVSEIRNHMKRIRSISKRLQSIDKHAIYLLH